MKRMCKYFISFYFLFVFVNGFSQEQKTTVKETEKDTIIYKSPYGIRVGIDISKPILSSINGLYSGFEIVGDYRISKRFFIATEMGYEEKTSEEDYTNSTSKGRIGIIKSTNDFTFSILPFFHAHSCGEI